VKRVGVHEIARRAKVSIGTVDRALHGRPGINEATRTKVLRIANQLGYSPDLAARALAVRRSPFVIGVCIPEEIRLFYDQMREGIFEEARRAGHIGLELIYRPVPSLGEGERQQLSGLLKEDIRGLIVMPGNPKVVTPLIDAAEERGIRVVCICSDAPQSRRSVVVYANPELQGRMAAELMAKFAADGDVAVITGMLRTEEHRLKVEGFRAHFVQQPQRGKIACVLEAHESEEESYRKTRELLARHPELSGIYVTTVNCLPVCRAVKEHGLASKVRLITTDLFPRMVPYFESGIIYASIYQDPYTQGRHAVRALVDHAIEKAPLVASESLNPGIVLRSNIHLFREIRTAAKERSGPRGIRAAKHAAVRA
jgi:LacI family transcriptional regulator